MTQITKTNKLKRIDVLIVVFTCVFVFLLVLGIVLPALYSARNTSYRTKCGYNLSALGKAMQIYAKDYDGEFPRAGGKSSTWSDSVSNWMADNRFSAYGLNPADGSGGMATIASSFYLLVKYADVSPKSFICPGDKGTTEFNPAEYNTDERELTDLWDFGPESREHCSYSYHMPYGMYPLTTSSIPGMAVAADPNPWIDSPSVEGKEPSLLAGYNPSGRRKETNIGNAVTHQKDGQSVLFMDTHVSFEKQPFCGINDDNIYTHWDGGDIRRGGLPLPLASESTDILDSFLVNDGELTVMPIGVANPEFLFEERNR